jgi:phosphatidate cytidylyltransferase
MFATRLVTAVVLVLSSSVALLFLPNAYWGAFLLPVLLVASAEWSALAGYHRGGRWLFGGTVLLCGVALFYLPHGGAGSAFSIPGQLQVIVYWISAAFWALLVPAWLAGKWRVRNALITGVTGWIVLLPGWLALATLQTRPTQLLTLLGVVWIADSAAYVIGRRFGRRRLAPEISPGKTWEGVLGAYFAVAVYYAALWFVFTPPQLLHRAAGAFILVAALTALSIEGDLFESWMKRQAGVKDSGTLLPGHGGVLDRIDGLTASMPLAALWLYYFGFPGRV